MGKLIYTFNYPKERVFNACIAAASLLKWTCTEMEAEYGRISMACFYKAHKFADKCWYNAECVFIQTNNNTQMAINIAIDVGFDITSLWKKVANKLYDTMTELLKEH